MPREGRARRPLAHMQRMRSMSIRSFPALERSPATGSKALQRLFFSSATIPPQHSKSGPSWPKIGNKNPTCTEVGLTFDPPDDTVQSEVIK